nr:hypothetical protein [Ktedonobacteraceae bacterium]
MFLKTQREDFSVQKTGELPTYDISLIEDDMYRELEREGLANMRLPGGNSAQVLTEGDIHLGDEAWRITSPH